MKKTTKAIIIAIIVAYIILLSAAGVFLSQPKGIPACQEWRGEGGTICGR